MTGRKSTARADYNKRYYQEHREEILAKRRLYEQHNRDKLLVRYRARYQMRRVERLAKDRLRYQANRAEKLAYQRQYQAAHRAEKRAYDARRNVTHAAQHLIQTRAWNRAHPDAKRAISSRYRARRAAAPLNDFTAAQWHEMQAVYGHRCVYCGKRAKGHLTQDHITPLSKGGAHTASNILPACRNCNSKKGARAPLVPVQPLLLTTISVKGDSHV